jgi:hypothetical protein
VANKHKQPIQKLIIALVPTTRQVTTSLPTYIPRGSNTNHWMEDNLEIHLNKVHLEGIRLKNQLSIHMLDLLDGQHLTCACSYHHGINHLFVQPMSKPATKLPYMKLQYPTYVKDTNPNVHIRVFKKAIKVNGEIVKSDIINVFGFTF